MSGKKVGNWLFGNEFELFAALVKNGMDPTKNKGVTIVQQPFDMNLFLQRKIDAASAMTYNELAQVLETKNPKTGKLYQLEDLNVIKMEDVGTGDARGRHLRARRLDQGHGEPGDREEVPRASFQGWIWCRDHSPDCTESCSRTAPMLGKGHQTWQMNEVNALIWPAPLRDRRDGPEGVFTRTASISSSSA